MTSLKIEKVTADGEVGRIIHDEILDEFCKSYILVGEDRTCLSEEYIPFAEAIKNFEVRDSDIWVASYPKTGTTWTQEMVWMIVSNLDLIGGKEPLYERFPYFEYSSTMNMAKFGKALNLNPTPERYSNSLEFVGKQLNPRFIKTHLPFSLLPDTIKNRTKSPKIIYVWRNPKDTCVSYCHHGNLLHGWRTTVEHFSKVFMDDKAPYGSFWKHVLGYWDGQKSHNILVIKYEDMKADLRSVIKRVSKFLKVDLTTEKIELLYKHLSFESMKNNKSVNGEDYVETLKENNLPFQDGSFIRSGIVGKHKEEFSFETEKLFDVWTKKNIRGTSLECEYDYNV